MFKIDGIGRLEISSLGTNGGGGELYLGKILTAEDMNSGRDEAKATRGKKIICCYGETL